MNPLYWLFGLLGVFLIAVVAQKVSLRREWKERRRMLHNLGCTCERFDDASERFRLKVAIKQIEEERCVENKR